MSSLRATIYRCEKLIVLAIVGVAAFLRFYHLSSLPTGFHGDEGVIGLTAQRILKEGYIGPYSDLGGGYPLGLTYLSTPFVWLFGNTIFAVRVAPALIGTLTVFAFYLLLRRNLDIYTALMGATFLATMNWHIHFSRLGFLMVIWSLCAVVTVAALMEALRRDDWRWWAATGGIAGLGIYAYNAHPLLLLVLGLFSLIHLVLSRGVTLRRRVGFLTAFALSALAIATPMILYAANPDNGYFTHFNRDSLFQSGEWQALQSLGAKASFLAGRYVGFWDGLSLHPKLDDYVDAMAVTPVVPAAMLLLAAAGIIIGFSRRRGSLIYLSALIILFMPLGFVFTTGGLARRTCAMAPFLVMFASLGVVELLRLSQARHINFRYLSWPVMTALCGFIVWRNLDDHFVKGPAAAEHPWVYCEAFTDAVRYMHQLPPRSHIYFCSERWTVNYEPRQFLAPEVGTSVPAEDRSAEFGSDRFEFDPNDGKPVFILLGHYRSRLETLKYRYPGGQTIEGHIGNRTTYIAYLPPVSSTTSGNQQAESTTQGVLPPP